MRADRHDVSNGEETRGSQSVFSPLMSRRDPAPMAFNNQMQDLFRKGLVWVVASAVTAASASIISQARQGAVHDHEIRAVEQQQITQALATARLAAAVDRLDVDVAKLDQYMADQNAAQEKSNVQH